MNVFLVVLLVLAGVALLLMEMFLLPGFGIAGVSGFLAHGGVYHSCGMPHPIGAGYLGIPAQSCIG